MNNSINALKLIAGCFAAMCIIFFSCHTQAQSISEMDMPAFQELKRQYEAKVRNDPFANSTSPADDLTTEDLQLTGIACGKTSAQAYALISGFVVQVGDKIASYRVDSIERDKVRLKRLDEVLVLSLGGGI